MIHKIVATGIILLFLVMTVTGTGKIDENDATSLAIAPTTGDNNNTQFQGIPEDFMGIGKTCYGYQVYPNPDILVWFDIDYPGFLHMIGIPISSDKIAGGTWVDGVWWCCEYVPISNSNIWIIDHVTGEMTLVGASGSSEGLHGLAYDDTTRTMYACGSTNLFTIDMETGAATLVGSFGISGSVMIGIASDGYGNIYGEDLHTDSLHSIDPATGTATLVGPLGLDLNYGQDMAIDKENGICYLSAFTVHAGNEGALYTCNLTTGTTTKIGNLGSEPTQITGFAIPYRLNNPPNPPIIDGPTEGKVGVEYEYSFISEDSESDDIDYMIRWDDGYITQLFDRPSGEVVYVNHTWNERGIYTIKAKAIDAFGLESDWAYLEVSMPVNQQNSHPFLNFFTDHFPFLHQLFQYFLQQRL